MAPEGDPTEAITGVEGEVDCATFNEAMKAEAREMAGDAELAPWAYVLGEEEASTAEREGGQPVLMLDAETILTFPKEGNAWLACVRENDVLWAPRGAGAFLARVKEMWELPDRAAFRVVPAGLTDVVMRGR